MSTTGRVIFAAVDGLRRDHEFARRIEVDNRAEVLVDYFVRRGVGVDEAQLLSLAYYAGRCHAADHLGILIDRVGAKR